MYIRRTLIPPDVPVILVGDSEFTPLQTLLEAWKWFYVFRQNGSHLFRRQRDESWRRVDSLVTEPGQQRWLTDIELTGAHRHHCNFLAYWKPGEKEPWLLATNLPSSQQTKRSYRTRMWVNEMFGDLKSNGFALESSRLRDFRKLSRLTLAVALLYVWLVAFGSSAIKNGKRRQVDCSNRRDLSIFRIGFDMFEKYLINEIPSLSEMCPTLPDLCQVARF